jgi:ABC-type polysaccharide/polyol phosphate export permease
MKTQQNYWEMVWVLAKTDFKLRYNNSWLGFVWVILKPLLIFLVLDFVFSHIFGGGIKFSLGLLTGIILWSFFAECTMVGMTSLLNKAHIITKISIPKWVIVVSSTLNTLLNFFLNLLVLAVFFILGGVFPNMLDIMIALYYCLIIYLISLSFSFFTAPLFLKFRDMNQIWEVLLTAGFYAAPIIYPMSIIPAHIQTLLYLNPMTFIIVHVKNILLENQFVYPLHHALYLSLAFISFIIGYLFFQKFSQRSAEHI